MKNETQPEPTEPKVPDHVKSVMEQLNRAQAFAASTKARNLYRAALKLIKDLDAQIAAWKDAADCSEPSELKSKLERMDKTLDSLSG